jgi:hypothetical protein
MYVPTNITLLGTLTPVSALDFSLNTFLGVSWMILLPYTILGIGLMIYGQNRLMRGERMLKRQDSIDNEIQATATLEPIAE